MPECPLTPAASRHSLGREGWGGAGRPKSDTHPRAPTSPRALTRVHQPRRQRVWRLMCPPPAPRRLGFSLLPHRRTAGRALVAGSLPPLHVLRCCLPLSKGPCVSEPPPALGACGVERRSRRRAGAATGAAACPACAARRSGRRRSAG